jgi:hypothetical protein
MAVPDPTDITFPSGDHAQVLYVDQEASGSELIRALKLPAPRALVVLNGGTAALEPDLDERLAEILCQGLARVAAEDELTLITGATNAGVFKLLGAGLEQWSRTAPCIGVTVARRVSLPDDVDSDTEQLEPHHSHFVLVDGDEWGDETVMMYRLVEALALDCPTISVFAGGGKIVLQEMQVNVEQGRRMILLAGSGRSTDAVLDARTNGAHGDGALARIARRGLIVPFNIHDEANAFRALLRRELYAAQSDGLDS